MRKRSVILTVVAVLVPAAPAAGAGPPPLGPADGVQATAQRGAVEIRFGPDAARSAGVAGREVVITCALRPAPGLLLGNGPGTVSSGASARVSADGTTVRTFLSDRPWDTCTVARGSAGLNDQPVARAALTPRGTSWLEDLAAAGGIYETTFAAGREGRYAATDDLVAAQGGAVVALGGPDDAPPPGAVGYWSDGAGRMTTAAVGTGGRRLLMEDLGDDLLRSNLGEFDSDYVPQDPQRRVDATYRDRRDRAVRHPPAAAGVRGARSGATVVLRFAGAAATRALRAVAGHRVVVRCVRRPPVLIGGVPRLFADAFVRAPRHGRTLRAAIPAGFDLCALADDGRLVATAALSPAARTLWRRLTAARDLLVALGDGLAPKGATTYPAPAAVVARRHGTGLVALAGPDAAVPAGRAGVWTDGAQRALVATQAGGKRLVLGDDGDGIRRSDADLEIGLLFVLDPGQIVAGGPS
jgi:hypothetical protein